MISRIIIPLILMLVLPQLYIDMHYTRHKKSTSRLRRLMAWLPSLILTIWAVCLAMSPNFMPDNKMLLSLFLVLLGLFGIPMALFALCSFVGWRWCKWRHKRINWGNLIGIIAALFAVFVLLWGSTIGFSKMEVKHLDISSDQLPAAFDGYRIVHFSDIHVGSYSGSRQQLIQRMADSINAQRPDAIMFTGDIQNMEPQEIYPFLQTLSSLQAPDGVFSVLGNHDYSYYLRGADDSVKAANERETCNRQQQMGWTLLMNEHRTLRRGNDSIVVAGMENLSQAPYPHNGDAQKAMLGVQPAAFTIMLQHDPDAWEKEILPKTTAQLTLSGHTHGGQFALFGWSPVSIKYKYGNGYYEKDNRMMFVTKGFGALLPFRFGATAEIVVITLHKK